MFGFFRISKFAFQDMARNAGLSFMTVFILVLMLLSVNTFFIIRHITGTATTSVRDQIDLSVYFRADAAPEEIDEVKTFIDTFPSVTQTTFQDKEAVLAQFREVHKDNPNILSSLDELEGNPFGSTLIVKTNTPADYRVLITALSIPEYEKVIESKTFADTEKAIQIIDLITKNIERFTVFLMIFFGLIAFSIIFNTIRVGIYTQRTEISIKKLVGATNWFVRGPYVVESLFFSVMSVVIAYAIVLLFASAADPYMAVFFQKPSFLTDYFLSHILVFAGGQFLAVAALSTCTSALAMRQHLRV